MAVAATLDPRAAAASMARARWQAVMRYLNDKAVEGRDTLAFAIHNPGRGTADDPGAHGLHEGWMRGTGQSLGELLPPNVAYQALDALGKGNELQAGIRSALGGGGFFGEAGYDQEDIEANRRGLDAALKHDMPRKPAPGPISDEITRRFMATRNARRTY